MPSEISWEIRERAEGLYIIDGLTYDQVADRTGVSVTQLKRWGADGKWTEQKKEYRRELSDLRRGSVQLRAKLLRKVLDSPSPDPQDVYALARFERVAALTTGAREEKIDIDRPAVFLENIEWLAKTLKDMDPEGLKVLAKNFDALIIKYKAEYAKTS